MKGTIITVFLALTATMASAQSREIDSLETLLKKAALHDTSKIALLNNLSYAYIYVDPTRGLSYANQSIDLCIRFKNNRRLGTAYNYKALNYASLGNDTLAITWYNQAIRLARLNFNKDGEGRALNNLAILYTDRSEYKKALGLRINALKLFEELKNNKAIGSLYNNIGVTYLYLADYPEALAYYFKALGIGQIMGDPNAQAQALMNIGLVYKKLGNYRSTFAYYQKSLTLYRQLGDQQQLANMYANLATAYDEQGQQQKALQLYNQALAINRQIKYKRGEAGNLTNIGIVYSNMRAYSESFHYLKQALGLYEQSPDYNSMSVIYNELAELMLTAPDTSLAKLNLLKSRLLEARSYVALGIKLSHESGSAEREMNGWQTQSLIHEKLHQYDAALSDYKKYTRLKDSIFNDEKKLAITRTEIQFEADKKQALAEAAVQREKIVKNTIMAGAGLLGLAAVALFISYKKRRDGVQVQQDLIHRSKVSAIEMKVLRLQLNPHFIFNSLNSISNFITRNDIKTADYFLAKFARLMRGTLENSEEREISLAEELQMTELYMQLEAIRLNQRFTYEFKVSADIDPNTTLVPPLILQPFVENSIWHGFAGKDEKGHILIEITRQEQLLLCFVTDDGIGRHEKTKAEGKKSFGVKITADRLALLNRSKDNLAGVRIIDLEKGTRVELKLPYESHFEA
ncbi:tetratricopeptide repeat protein [Mucilaginibacter dorajii]|uniref:Signal transduction histidine kinase internal region domain-containing protein n=1 Tax=Mucilaginibacter dorajii TaxID=692994 RepID=A0ABP7PX80_9SPHI|nr:tetratricopeptide repeat protein [Mucilaginibacter dorajii]MCS3737981.1 tetratricopeptide (TPR) repeat protein/anti-sigma regulatory factor (Ser/Thr protein kinase) [Mucilaginibacter dorajii]